MISHPKIGTTVKVWYAAKARHARPLHGKTGTVVIASKRKPRNHGILIDDVMYVVPAGNLQPVEANQ